MSFDYYGEEDEEAEVLFEAEEEVSSEEPPMEEWSSLILHGASQNEKQILQSQGLYDPGSGLICSKYIAQSDSSIFRHLYYNYPAVKDPGIKKALLQPEDKIVYPNDGQELYLAICNEENICPVRMFYRGLLEDCIDLKYYAVNPMQVHAMATALEYNKIVKTLHLTDNFLNDDACYHLGQMLVANNSITKLNLSGCRIGPSGIKRVLSGLLLNRALRSINLSRNEIGDAGAEHLAYHIMRGIDIEKIYLSKNEIGSKGAKFLADALEIHNKLTHIDLSWNNLYSPLGTVNLINVLSVNKNLQELDLSWNSIAGPRTALAIKNVLRAPKLQHLNLSNNQLSGDAINIIVESLAKAKKLVTFNLSFNPLSPGDALKVLTKMKLNNVKVQNLLMDNVYVTKRFVRLLDEIMKLKFRKNFVMKYGGVYTDSSATGPDPRELLLDRAEYLAKKPKKRPVDIALVTMQLLKYNGNALILSKDYCSALQDAGAPIDEDLINEFSEVFGLKNKLGKMVDLKILVDYMKRKWPERKLPPSPPPEPQLEAVAEPEPASKAGKGKGGKGRK